MKIIASDNYARENRSDSLIAENVNEYIGNEMVKLWNDKFATHGDTILRLVPDDWPLYKFEP